MNNLDFTTIGEAIRQASLLFSKNGIQSPRLHAEVLLQELLGWPKVKLFTEDRELFPADKKGLFLTFVERRLQGEPLQYIVGKQEFYGRDFHVNPSVLIPRPETEILIEEILKRRDWWAGKQVPSRKGPFIADIGTGSGAIAVTMALEWPEADVYTVDISPDAIQVAQENARRLSATVQFLQGDLVEPLVQLDQRFDILISNPPYIPSQDIAELAVEVREHEPRLALDGGLDGLEPYRRMTQSLSAIMKETEPALVGFEVGIHQAEDVAKMMEQCWYDSEIEIVKDLQGINRVVLGWKCR